MIVVLGGYVLGLKYLLEVVLMRGIATSCICSVSCSGPL